MTFTTESVETLAEWFHETTLACAHRGDVRECAMRAAALIASDWMKRHDAEVRAEGVAALLAEAENRQFPAPAQAALREDNGYVSMTTLRLCAAALAEEGGR